MSAALATKTQLTSRALGIKARLKLEDESFLAQLRATNAGLRADKTELAALKVALEHNRSKFVDDNPTIVEQASKVAALEARIRTRTEKVDRSKGRKTAAMVEAELRKILPGVEGFADADVKLKAGVTAAALVPLDSKIDAVAAKRKAVRNAARPVAERRAAMEKQIKAMAQRGKPDVSNLAYGGPVKFAQTRVGRTGNTFEYANDGAALVAWLYEDDLILKLDSLIAADSDKGSISVAAQLRTLDELRDELLTLHRERAAVVNRLAAEGHELHHRPDAPVEAVLMVEIL